MEHHHEERFTRLAGLIENFLADFREILGRIFAFVDFSRDLSVFCGNIEPRVVVYALTLINHPTVPVVSPDCVRAAAMEFTDKRCVVAALSQVAADGFDFRRKTHENRNSVFVAVLSSQNARARRGADRIRAHDVREDHSLARHRVDMRRPVDAAAVRGNRMGGVIVGHDKEDVHLLRSCRRDKSVAPLSLQSHSRIDSAAPGERRRRTEAQKKISS